MLSVAPVKNVSPTASARHLRKQYRHGLDLWILLTQVTHPSTDHGQRTRWNYPTLSQEGDEGQHLMVGLGNRCTRRGLASLHRIRHHAAVQRGRLGSQVARIGRATGRE